MTWNLFVLYFGGWTLQNKVFAKQNKGHLGSRDIYHTYINILWRFFGDSMTQWPSFDPPGLFWR